MVIKKGLRVSYNQPLVLNIGSTESLCFRSNYCKINLCEVRFIDPGSSYEDCRVVANGAWSTNVGERSEKIHE